jgi:hypothetical protein
MDLIYIGLVFVLFGFTWGLIKLCGRLGGVR